MLFKSEKEAELTLNSELYKRQSVQTPTKRPLFRQEQQRDKIDSQQRANIPKKESENTFLSLIVLVWMVSVATMLVTTAKKDVSSKGQRPAGRRVKSITKMVQKQSSSLFYTLLVIVWVVAVAAVLLLAFRAKMEVVEMAALQQIQQCKNEYSLNRCETPVKGIINFCNQKLACSNENALQLAGRRVSYSRIAGQITQEFANGAGIAGLFLGVILVWLCLRQKGKEKLVTSMQFFDD